MADKTIGELPEVKVLNADDLLAVEHGGVASKFTADSFANFGRQAVQVYVESAKTSANQAAGSATSAASSAEASSTSAGEAASSASAALASQTAAAGSAKAAAGSATEAKGSADRAAAEAEDAQASAAAAKASEDAAALSETHASDSETAAAASEAKAKASQEAAAESELKAKASENEAAGSETAAAESAEKAKQYSGKPPAIKDGTWWTWDADQQTYVDTGEPARGNLMYAGFWVDLDTGTLYMVTDDEYTGPDFRLNGNILEVVIDAGSQP